jgi:hypothetical protein
MAVQRLQLERYPQSRLEALPEVPRHCDYAPLTGHLGAQPASPRLDLAVARQSDGRDKDEHD